MAKYTTTIGIEVHLELKTNSKIFSSTVNNYGNIANSAVNIIDLGYPGVLPTLNKEVVNLALKAALILNCEINTKMHFDRKNYFYPDNPKNYQITQSRTPIGHDGYIDITLDSGKKQIGIERIHMEEDTCKSIHQGDTTLLDFNRSGVPLVEIVTKPVIKSSEEAISYLEALREMMLYADISDCKIEEGSMRCDVNVSLSDTDILGTKCEIKNIGSIKNVGLAIESEIKRQEFLLENNQTIIEQTRRFNDKTNETVLLREKETANDYRYFPEPDIPYLIISRDQIIKTKSTINILPNEIREIYLTRGLNLININKLINNRPLNKFLLEFIPTNLNLVIASNLILGDISSYLNKNNKQLTDTYLTKERFSDLVTKLNNQEISNKTFKDILIPLLESTISIDDLISQNVSKDLSEEELKGIIIKILTTNEQSINDYKKGLDRSVKYLMGQIMKETKGHTDPVLANKLLIAELQKY